MSAWTRTSWPWARTTRAPRTSSSRPGCHPGPGHLHQQIRSRSMGANVTRAEFVGTTQPVTYMSDGPVHPGETWHGAAGLNTAHALAGHLIGKRIQGISGPVADDGQSDDASEPRQVP